MCKATAMAAGVSKGMGLEAKGPQGRGEVGRVGLSGRGGRWIGARVNAQGPPPNTACMFSVQA